jgi:HD-like signal output (HDOD) protein
MSTAEKQQPNKRRTIDEWANILLEKDLPIFSNTAQKITEIIKDKKSGAMELASSILQDPTLTAKTLKLANSTYYNPSNQKLGTITRAIVILGSQTVHNLSITCAFIDSALEVEDQTRVNQELAIAIHAAVQAKQLAILAQDHSPEEIFIAALLKNLGAISFWCSGDNSTHELDALLKTGKVPAKKAEIEVLGFHLSRLGASLSQKWQLSGLIKQAISDHYEDNERAQFVQQGHRLAILLKSKKNKNKEALETCLREISESTEISHTSLRKRVLENSKNAANIASQFGAHQAAALIHSLPKTKTGSKEEPLQSKQKTGMQPAENTSNHEIQLQILQEIGDLLEDDIKINHLFEMVIEGIQRGTRMDRTLFTLLSPDRSTLKEKTALGWLDDADHKPFSFSLTSSENNLFKQTLNQSNPTWIDFKKNPEQKELFTPDVENLIQTNNCFIAPIKVNKKVIGLLYADRATSKTCLTQNDFNSFCQFSRQANIGLALSQTR